MREYAATFRATQARIARRLADAPPSEAPTVIKDELRGLYHDLLVIFDGGTSLADQGLLSIVDEVGVAFDRYLHEICFQYWPEKRSESGGAACEGDSNLR